jgi:multidrug transporter EmrE-like cation transporter
MSSTFFEIPTSTIDKIYFFLKVFIDPFIIFAVVCILLSGVNWMIAMTKFELSSVYPMVVVGLMILATMSSIFLFSEEINIYKIFGIATSILGVYILYIGSK